MTTTLRRLIVSVADLDRALAFYRDVLGLTAAGVEGPIVALVGAKGLEVMLHERPATSSRAGVAASFAVADVDAVTTAAATAGCTVLDAPADQPWGERQSVLTDPDGHVVCIVSPVTGR